MKNDKYSQHVIGATTKSKLRDGDIVDSSWRDAHKSESDWRIDASLKKYGL